MLRVSDEETKPTVEFGSVHVGSNLGEGLDMTDDGQEKAVGRWR